MANTSDDTTTTSSTVGHTGNAEQEQAVLPLHRHVIQHLV